jgi:hypothetical protein
VTQEPSATTVTAALVAIGLAVAAAATLVLLHATPARPMKARAARLGALRRGVEIGIVAALIASLQVAGGLTPLTGLFVALAFAIAEYVLSAGASAAR